MSSPLIIVPTLGQSVLYLTDTHGSKTKKAWPFELDGDALMNELKGSIMKLMLFRVDGGFSDRIASIVRDVCEPFALDDNGERLHNIAVSEIKASFADMPDEQKSFVNKMLPCDKIAEKIGKENLFYFAYDFLADPQKTANELASYINFVKEKTNSAKVSLAVCGTGGAAVKAYMSAFANENCLEKVIFVSASLDGMTLAADLIENKLKLENPAELLSSLGGKAAAVSQFAGMLPPDVMSNIITKSLDASQKTIVTNSAFVWSLVPSARFENAVANSSCSSDFKAKLSKISALSQSFSGVVNCFKLGGTKVSFFCGSGRELPPVASVASNSDGITDVFSSSLGGAFPENTVYCAEKSIKDILVSDEFLSLI